MLSLTIIPSANPDIVSRIIDQEAVLVMPVQGKVKVLNEVGGRIWELIDGVRNIGEIITAIRQEYNTTPETATRDTTEFLTQLNERNMITFS